MWLLLTLLVSAGVVPVAAIDLIGVRALGSKWISETDIAVASIKVSAGIALSAAITSKWTTDLNKLGRG
ncbi:hypothetical protein DL768_007761 [Monosporascus sp. mg162]|nr:hypothetical protein DL768_007761 [Monosporascus sp. mg162]